jgi:hypothetical protein
MIVREHLGVRVEVLMAPESPMLVNGATEHIGWRRDYETERKLMQGIEHAPVSVRVFLGE